MCNGANAFFKTIDPVFYPAVKAIGQGAKGAINSLGPKKGPDVVREDPVAQQAKLESDAAQSSQAQTLALRKRARANSLLSAAGGLGDTTPANVSTPQVAGKPDLGS